MSSEETQAPFDHRAHLALAFDALVQHGLAGAMARVPATLQTLASVHGAPGKYHETRTVAWLLEVADRMARTDSRDTWNPGSLDTLLTEFPELLEPTLVDRRYHASTLRSERARTHYLLPDRR